MFVQLKQREQFGHALATIPTYQRNPFCSPKFGSLSLPTFTFNCKPTSTSKDPAISETQHGTIQQYRSIAANAESHITGSNNSTRQGTKVSARCNFLSIPMAVDARFSCPWRLKRKNGDAFQTILTSLPKSTRHFLYYFV